MATPYSPKWTSSLISNVIIKYALDSISIYMIAIYPNDVTRTWKNGANHYLMILSKWFSIFWACSGGLDWTLVSILWLLDRELKRMYDVVALVLRWWRRYLASFHKCLDVFSTYEFSSKDVNVQWDLDIKKLEFLNPGNDANLLGVENNKWKVYKFFAHTLTMVCNSGK